MREQLPCGTPQGNGVCHPMTHTSIARKHTDEVTLDHKTNNMVYVHVLPSIGQIHSITFEKIWPTNHSYSYHDFMYDFLSLGVEL